MLSGKLPGQREATKMIAQEDTANVVNMSGGKDSTATVLLAIEQEVPNIEGAFADTGNEHRLTYEYIDYLEKVLPINIRRVRANFDQRIAAKRNYIKAYWGSKLYPELIAEGYEHGEAAGITYRRICQALDVLQPTGNPFLDLCLWKGRFPSRKAQFCTQELKSLPIDQQVLLPLAKKFRRVVSWQGIRRDESANRANATRDEMLFGNAETGEGLWIHRPILEWTAEDTFFMHKKHGIKWNPLYEKGMGRVGCMPCINCNKKEMREIDRYFPDEIERIKDWESMVSAASKREQSTFMPVRGVANMLGFDQKTTPIDHKRHGIDAFVQWAKTPRSGKMDPNQFALDISDDEPTRICSSVYGLCE